MYGLTAVKADSERRIFGYFIKYQVFDMRLCKYVAHIAERTAGGRAVSAADYGCTLSDNERCTVLLQTPAP